MATINSTSSTNNANAVLWSFSTKLEWRTDRPAGSVALHGQVQAIENLGIGVTATDPFTLLS